MFMGKVVWGLQRGLWAERMMCEKAGKWELISPENGCDGGTEDEAEKVIRGRLMYPCWVAKIMF